MQSVLTPNASRREARRHSRRETILDVATRSFFESGYAATKMSEIAASLGGSKGTLWSYFDCKEQLFAAVLDRAIRDFQHELLLMLNPNDQVEDALSRFCGHFLGKLTSPEGIALHRLAVSEANRFPAMGQIFYEIGPGRTREVLEEYLHGAMERGALRSGDPASAARLLAGMCLSGCHTLLLVGVIERVTPAMINEDVKLAVGTFMRAWAIKKPLECS